METTTDKKLNILFEKNAASLRRGIIEFAVMVICHGKPQYVAEIITRLKTADIDVVEGTLYPLLSRLHKQQLMSYEWQESEQGPPRKYYQLTDDGVAVLRNYQENWDVLVKAIKSLDQGDNNE